MIHDACLSNLWHPVARSAELTDRPLAVRVLDEAVVVFRTSRGVYAFKDLCIHRGVPLSLGRVTKDELVCAYHGWAYDGCGSCTRIPSMPAGQTIPPKAKAFAYGCAEAEGFVWVKTGTRGDEPPPLVGRLDETLKRTYMGPYELEASAPRLIENFLDVSHLMFVHEGLLGDPGHAEIGEYEVREEKDGTLRSDEIAVFQPNSDGTGRTVVNRYVYEVIHPLCAALTKFGDDGTYFKLYLAVLPVTERRSKAYMVMERDYARDDPDETFVRFQDVLIEQDRLIVEHQKPELLPLDLQAELHLKCDRMSIAYRRSLKERGVSFGTA